MANHLTPEELADELGVERTEVLVNCVRFGVPVYHGRVDRTLYDVAVEDQQRRQPHAQPSPTERLH
jgi:hypothetical protein